jgi:hypothetical protein
MRSRSQSTRRRSATAKNTLPTTPRDAAAAMSAITSALMAAGNAAARSQLGRHAFGRSSSASGAIAAGRHR